MSAVVAPHHQQLSDGLTKVERFDMACRTNDRLPSIVFQRLTDDEAPETLEQIAKSMGFPRGPFVEWFTTEHGGRYSAALKVLGGGVAHAVKQMTDDATDATLKLVKFKTDRYLRLAGHWDPERYSPRTEVKHSGLVPSLVIEINAAPSIEGRLVGEGSAALPAASQPAARVHEMI